MPKITLEDVQAAVDKLEAEGLSVSVVSVRGVLRRGSSTTITKLLREVRRAKAASDKLPADVDATGVPPEVILKIAEAAKSAAISAFRAIAEPVNQAIANARTDMNAERQSLLQDNAHVSADAAEALERLDAARKELDVAIRETATAGAELLAAREQLRATEARYSAERGQLMEELAQARAQNVSAQSEWNREQERIRERLEGAINEAAELRGRLSVFTEHSGPRTMNRDQGVPAA